MSLAAPPTVAVVLPPREGFGPRLSRGIGLTVRHHALATSGYRTVVFGGAQEGPVFLDVTFRLVRSMFHVPASARVRYVLGLLRPLRLLRPKLIEVHAEPRIALLLQRFFPSVPVVLVVHDDPGASRQTRTPGRRANLCDRLARVVTISSWLRDRFLEGVDKPTRAPVVIPPCVDVGNLPQTANTLDTVGIPMARRRTRLVLFAGRLVPDKGANLFIAACTSALPSLPGWRAEIIGGAEHRAQTIQTSFIRLLQATAEPASIALMGYRDHPDVMAAMARSAIVVIPGQAAEPGGRIALEALANGAAVICATHGALPEICGDAAIYVESGKPEDFAAAIRSLGQDPPRLVAMGEAGRQRAKEYDLVRIGRLVDQLRAQIIAEKPPRL